jgi:hypothetical protein
MSNMFKSDLAPTFWGTVIVIIISACFIRGLVEFVAWIIEHVSISI